MKEIYREIGAETVSRDFILLNPTENRMLTFDFFFGLTMGIPVLIMIFSYNRQGITGLICTLTLIILVIAINKWKPRLCHKTILFDRKSRQIRIEQSFPKVNKTINYSEVRFTSRTQYAGSSGYDTIFLKHNKKKYRLYDRSLNSTYHDFLQDFMVSNKSTINKIEDYNRKDDLINNNCSQKKEK